mmetsp:Transcript_47671/g.138881  ORF Transcript_47671/g.138881 Transcript_47671/m.138881 type:complete len:269 (+) Transcript_47671:98-904(+)
MGRSYTCCDILCCPCICCLRTDRLCFDVEDGNWREAFSQAGGCWAACCYGVYPAFRASLFLLWLVCVGQSFYAHIDYYNSPFGYWFTQLTHWSALLQLAYLGFAMYSAIKANTPRPKVEVEKTPCYVSLTWALGTAVPVVALMVMVLYWGLVYEGGPVRLETVTMHGGNLALAIIDIISTRQPYYIHHVYVPMLFAAIYMGFTYIYYRAGGTNSAGDPYIYSSLDWSEPQDVGRMAAIVILVAGPAAYMLFFVLVAMRRCCQKRIDSE